MSRVPLTTRAPHAAFAHRHAAATLLVLAIAACGGGGDGGGGPAVVTPTRIEVVGNAPEATVDAVVTPAPAVKLTDAAGKPAKGIGVTFTAEGGGTITGGSQVTNSDGIATVGSWRLGTTSGAGNVLTATAGTLSTSITATANAGPAVHHLVDAALPDSQITTPATLAPFAPSVRVTDQYGNGVKGAIVTFAPGANSGTVTGGLQTTDDAGVASAASWTMGAGAGRQVLQASIAGSALPPVSFVANAFQLSDPCTALPHALVSNVGASLAAGDCAPDGYYTDGYVVTSATPINHEFRQRSATIDTYLLAYTPSGEILGLVDDESNSNTNSAMRFIAPAGSYILGASSYDAGETGAYKMSSVSTPIPAGCAFNAFVVPGASWSGSLASTDCEETAGNGSTGRGDDYLLVLYPGRSAVVTMRSTAFDSYITVLRSAQSGLVLEVKDDNSAGGSDARVTVTNSSAVPTLYLVVATGNLATATGAYTVTVSPPTGPALAAPAIATRPDALRRASEAAASLRPAIASAKAPRGGSR